VPKFTQDNVPFVLSPFAAATAAQRTFATHDSSDCFCGAVSQTVGCVLKRVRTEFNIQNAMQNTQ